MKDILLKISTGIKENTTEIIIEKLSENKTDGNHFNNVNVKINVRKKALPEIKDALYFPGITTIFLRSKNLNVVNEK